MLLAAGVFLPLLGFQLALLMQGLDGLVDGSGHMLGRDFVNVWTAGRLVLGGKVALLHDLAGYHAAQDALLGHDLPFHNWSYPPLFLPFTVPFGALGYAAALALWSVGTLALMLAAGRLAGLGGWGLLLLALSPALAFNLWDGQNGFLSAALLMGGLALLDRRPAAAGILFGLLAYKPHLGILLPVALLAAGAWRAIASTVATVAVLAAGSVALFGVEPWLAWAGTTAAYQRALLDTGTGPFTLMMPGAVMAARLAGLPLSLAWGLALALAALSVGLVWRAFRRGAADPLDRDLRNALLLAATVLATPYAFAYDMTLTAAAAMLALQHGDVLARRRWLLFSLLAAWALPAALLSLNALRLPIGPLVLLASVLSLAFAREAERRRQGSA